ncbi:phospholipase D family protein [Sphingobium sp. DC-2]|uniref:phospholipase D family protein n=1 Tax=Sphingobium sp. DC-2 TaxID=1303256 RepID=UPI0004C408D6|nr:phospholipase D family protein [Sphingobium sp. DC-2]
MTWVQYLGVGLLLLCVAVISLRLLYPLPPLDPRSSSRHLSDTEDTPLGAGVAALRRGHPRLSGVHILTEGREAFAARVLLARAATRTLDVQYYIWHPDLSGTLMLEAMLAAAERGVRVRMLLDDNGVAGLDGDLAALARHPNVEIRLFNPFVIRRPKALGYLADFGRLNRRMHNKSFTADNQATIIGGRNIGDEYFAARDQGLFSDLDVLAVGPVVDEVSQDFDRYWASDSAYPAERILAAIPTAEPDAIHRRASLLERDPAARAYLEAVRALPFVEQILAGSLPFEWSAIRMVSDDPAKGLGRAGDDKLLVHVLQDAVGTPTRELRLVSGYFVPTAAGVDVFGGLAREGRDVAIFTNAFEATDVWIVHAGYAHRRRALLEQGVRLFEMRGERASEGRRKLITTGSGSGSRGKDGPVLRSAGSTLHSKTFAVDRTRLFIGSFNFDPRSMHLNTELGFLIDSPTMAAAVARAFDDAIPMRAYEVVIGEDGHLRWIERGDVGRIVHEVEPGTTRWQRGGLWLLSKLPIEWLL